MTLYELATLEGLLRTYVAEHATSPAVVDAANTVVKAVRGVRGKQLAAKKWELEQTLHG